MKKVMLTVMFSLALVLALGTVVSAQDNAAEQPVAAKVTGVNYNLAATLAKGAEADATYGKLNALKVTTAVGADGKAIEGLAGKTVYYVPTKAAASLLGGEEGKTVTVNGKLFVGAGAIVVESVEAGAAAADQGGGDEWDNIGVKTMSKQPII